MSRIGQLFRKKLAGKEIQPDEQDWLKLEAMLNAADVKPVGFWAKNLDNITLFLVTTTLIGGLAFVQQNTVNQASFTSSNKYFESSTAINHNQVDKQFLIETAHEKQTIKSSEESKIIDASNSSETPLKKEHKVATEENNSNPNKPKRTNSEYFHRDVQKSVSFSQEQSLAEDALVSVDIKAELMEFLLLKKAVFPELNPSELSRGKDEFSYNKKKLSWSVGLAGEVGITPKTVSGENEELVSRRNTEENAGLNGGAGFQVGLHFNHFTFSTGLTSLSYGENTNYKPELYQWVFDDKIDWKVNNSGYWQNTEKTVTLITDSSYWELKDTTVCYWNSYTNSLDSADVYTYELVVHPIDTTVLTFNDSVYVNTYDSTKIVTRDSSFLRVTDIGDKKKLKNKNTFRYVEIPLYIGYETQIKRWTIGVNTGVGIGILTRQTVHYLNEDISDVEEVEISQAKTIMYNYLLSASANYWLDSHWSIGVAPTYRKNLNTLFKEEAPTQQKYQWIGFSTWVRYRF